MLLCPEHKLLGDDWETFLHSLSYTPEQLDFAKQSLIRLLDVSEDKVRNGSKTQGRRKQNLRKQIERLELWQAKNKLCTDKNVNSMNERFIPFVPFLNP